MFEKEAEEYATHNDWFEFSANVDKIGNAIRTKMKRAYIAGAEFGYNKAKEEMQGQEFSLRYENGIYKYKDKSGKEFESTDGKTWKEIVLPELKESE